MAIITNRSNDSVRLTGAEAIQYAGAVGLPLANGRSVESYVGAEDCAERADAFDSAEIKVPATALVRTVTPLYVVETSRDNPEHHGLRTNTASHLLTTRPGRSDVIAETIDLVVDRLPGGLAVAAVVQEHPVSRESFCLVTHAGRSASLGEDGLEDASGHDALTAYVPEILGEAGWRYAPCELRRLPDLYAPIFRVYYPDERGGWTEDRLDPAPKRR